MSQRKNGKTIPGIHGPQESSFWRAIWQVFNSFIPYALLWYAMVLALPISYWLMLPIAFLAAGFLARIFIIFHDCGHASFFLSRRANHMMGALAGFLNLTPYRHWRWQHALHHGTSGDLDKRGFGDIWMLTVQEFNAASRWTRLKYRLARNPVVLFILAPLYIFLVHHRFSGSGAPAAERRSVWKTNLALVGVAMVMSAWIGFESFVIIQCTVSLITGAAAIWLFYVQHQYDGAHWSRSSEWTYAAAALEGSSYYKLPPVLQWFTGNIGFHHVHHWNPRIPNYFLQMTHEREARFKTIEPLSVRASLRSLTYRLWDERLQRCVGYRSVTQNAY